MITMKLITREFNVETGVEVITERDETTKEIAERLALAKEVAAAQVIAEATATQKAALLARLGITADEAKLLIG